METKVLFGIQTAKGTPKDADLTILPFTEFTVKPEVNKIESKVLSSGRWTKDTFAGRQSVSGDLSVEPTIDTLELLLQIAGFTKSTDTYKSGQFDKYATIINDFTHDGMHLKYEDCLINNLTITAQQEAFLNVKTSVIGMKSSVNDTKFSGTSKETDDKPLICYGAVLKSEDTDDSAIVESVEISINNSLEGKGGLNTRYNTKIVQNGRGSVEVNIQFNSFEKNNYLKAMEMLTNNKSLKLELILKENISEQNKGRTMTIELPRVKMTNVELGDLEGAGTLTRQMSALPINGDPITFKITGTKETATVRREE